MARYSARDGAYRVSAAAPPRAAGSARLVRVRVRVRVRVKVRVRVRVRDRVRVRRRCSSERPTKRKSTAMSSRLRSSANETRVERFSASSSRPG